MHQKLRQKAAAVSILVILALMVFAPGAIADQVYHSEKLAFEAVDNAPLRSGSVVNIHPNGPQVFAHEIYMLKGAAPNLTYEVFLTVYSDPGTCGTVYAGPLHMASLETNAAGNGKSGAKITPDTIATLGLHNTTVGAAWTVEHEGETHYETTCTTVVLD